MRATPLFLPVLLAAIACVPSAGRGSGSGGEGYLISAERIRESGATDAWEALVRTNAHLGLNENASGEPIALSHRGRNSIALSSTPLLVVDEVVMADFRYLRRIPAESIAFIRILNGSEGTMRYGTGAGNGVIVVETEAR